MKDEKQIKFDELKPVLKEDVMLSSWEGEQKKVEDFLGETFGVIDFIMLPSTFEGSTEYASVQGIDSKSKLFWFNTSSGVVCRKLKTLKDNGKLPAKAKIVSAKGKKGRDYNDLVNPDWTPE